MFAEAAQAPAVSYIHNSLSKGQEHERKSKTNNRAGVCAGCGLAGLGESDTHLRIRFFAQQSAPDRRIAKRPHRIRGEGVVPVDD
jgi:hypothetical protein